jgi:hypothetical protein
MIDLFETNTAAADMFLSLDVNDADLRWAWISNKLTQMHHLPLPSREMARLVVAAAFSGEMAEDV